jgi:hypothetical protein
MSLLGKGAMVMWHNLKPAAATDHDDWHSHEHIPERIGLVGFRRGRRCRSLGEGGGWFLMYEVDDVAVLSSPAYLGRVNDPSAWSATIIPSIIDMNRTLATVESSHGVGVGAFVVTLRMPAMDLADRLAELPGAQGVVGAHLLRGDPAASGIVTKEKSLRERPDEAADMIVLIEGYDAALLNAAVDRLMADPDMPAAVVRGCYQLNHVVAEADL